MVNAHLNSTLINSLTLGRIRSKSTHFNRCLSIGVLVAFVLIFSAPAEARRYQPPTGDPPKGSFGSNGSRGCDLTQESKPDELERKMVLEQSNTQTVSGQPKSVPITLLAPLRHVGRTSSLTPTLAWFVTSTAPYRVKISLFTVDSDQSSDLLYELEYVETSSGFVQYTLPADKSNLQAGQRYFVQLSVACHTSSDLFDKSFVVEMDVEMPSSALKQALSQARTPQQKAALFAEAGYWFDTVRELLKEATGSNSYQQLRLLLKELAQSEVKENHRQALVNIADRLNDANLSPSAQPVNLNRPPSTPLN